MESRGSAGSSGSSMTPEEEAARQKAALEHRKLQLKAEALQKQVQGWWW